MTPRDQFARNLRTAREGLGISQEALGAKAALHRTEVSLLERSKRDPRLETLIKLARALEISPSALLEGIE